MGQGVNLRTGIIGILTLGAAWGEMTVAGTGWGRKMTVLVHGGTGSNL